MKQTHTFASIVRAALLVLLAILNSQLSICFGQGTAFTYQGRLNDGANPANGTYALRFTLYNGDTNVIFPIIVAGPITNYAVKVSNGLFATTLDFGAGMFDGANRWLEIGVRGTNDIDFRTLTPRQPITPTPYAIATENLIGKINASNIPNGTITAAQIASNQVVTSLNGLRNDVAIQAGANITLSTNFITNSITISASGGGGANGWLLTGNAGTVAGPNFVGTIDNRALELRVNSSRALRLEPGVGAPNVIGGSLDNAAGAGVGGASIGGGDDNTVYGNYSTIGGGGLNGVSGLYSTIGGGNYNLIPVGDDYSTIGGGQHNAVNAKNSTISGGLQNTLFAQYSIISGGHSNIIGGEGYATIAGGLQNAVNGEYSTVGGGYLNSIDASAYSSIISGGNGNRIVLGGSYSAIGGGQFNAINTSFATVGGGWSNTIAASSVQSIIGGGQRNAIGSSSPASTISGGNFNSVVSFANYATIGGGSSNTIGEFDSFATIAGGSGNYNGGFYSTIGGGSANIISNNDCTIAGGVQNVISGGQYSAIAGGQFNSINGAYTTIGGGRNNTNSSSDATIGGGLHNVIQTNANQAFIGGGSQNVISNSSASSFIGGGFLNRIGSNSPNAIILGGQQNVIDSGASSSVIAGGSGNYVGPGAGGCFVAGSNCQATNGGCFVWGGGSTTGPGQFLIFTTGGVGINKNNPGANAFLPDKALDVHGSIAADSTILAPIISASVLLTVNGPITATGKICADGGISCISDRNAKENFESIDTRDVLNRIAQLPLSRWNYKTDPRTSHIGPMAQDFYAAFNVGSDDKHIGVLDEGGVALAAIQGLNQKVEEQRTALRARDEKIKELEKRLAHMEQLLTETRSR